MNNEKLNTLVNEYQQTQADGTFREIYEMVSPLWSSTLATTARSLNADEHSLQERYEDTLLNCIAKYDGSANFSHYFKAAMVQARRMLYRKHKRIFDREVYVDEGAPTPTLLYDKPDETDYEAAIKKADQRQLIDSLTDPTKTDDLTQAIIANFEDYDSNVALAKALGIGRRVVERRLRRLAKNFDESKFGNYRDYLLIAQ